MSENVGYATLTVIPSMRGFAASLKGQVSPVMSSAGKDAGDTFGVAFSAQVQSSVSSRLRGLGSVVTSAVGSAVSGIGSVVAGIGRVMSTGITVATGAAAALGATVLKSGLTFNTLNQTSLAAFKTILGGATAANQMMDQINAFAKTSPFPKDAFISATQQLLGFGVSAKQIIPTLQAIQDAVAATGGGADEISNISYALAQIQGEGKLTGQTLNQLGQYGINAAALIGKQMGKTSDQIRAMASAPGGIPANQVFTPLINGLEKQFGGAAANVKQTWVGATDRIKAALRDLGSGLIEPFVSQRGGGAAVDWANQIADAIRALTADVLPGITGQLNKIVTYVGGLVGQVTTFLKKLNGPEVSGFLSKLSAMAPLAAAAGSAIAIIGSQNIPVLGSLLGAINPVAGALVAMAAATPAVRDAFGQLYAQVSPIVSALAKQLAPVLQSMLPTLGLIAGQFGGVLANAIGIAAGGIQSFLPLVSILASSFTAIAGPLLTGLAQAFEQIAPSIAPIVQILGQGLGDAMRIIAPLLPQVGVAFVAIGRVLSGGLAALLPIVATAFAALARAVLPLIPPLAQLAQSVLNSLAAALGPLVTALAPLIQQLGQALFPIIQKLLPIFDGLRPVLDKVGQVIAQTLAPALLRLLEAALPLIPALANLALTVLKSGATLLSDLAPAISVVVTALSGLLTLAAPIINFLARQQGLVTALVIAWTGMKVLSGISALFSALPFLANPVILAIAGIGLAVGGVVYALSHMSGGFQDAIARGKDLASQARETGNSLENLVSKDLLNRLTNNGLLGELAKAGISLDEFKTAALGSDASFKGLLRNLQAIEQQQGGLFGGGQPVAGVILQLEALHKEYESGKLSQDNYEKSLAALGISADGTGDAFATLSDQIQNFNDKTLGGLKAGDAFQRQLNDLPQQFKDAASAGLNLNNAWTDNSNAAIDLRGHMLDMVTSAGQLITQWANQGISGQALTDKVNGLNQSIRDSATAAGIPGPAIDFLIGLINQIPQNKTTTFTADVSGAISAVQSLKNTIDSTVGSFGDQVLGAFGVHATTHAAGGNLTEGWNILGEQGWEFAYKSGSKVQVFPHDQSSQLVGTASRPSPSSLLDHDDSSLTSGAQRSPLSYLQPIEPPPAPAPQPRPSVNLTATLLIDGKEVKAQLVKVDEEWK